MIKRNSNDSVDDKNITAVTQPGPHCSKGEQLPPLKNLCLKDSAVRSANTYLLDSDSSVGVRYMPFEELRAV